MQLRRMSHYLYERFFVVLSSVHYGIPDLQRNISICSKIHDILEFVKPHHKQEISFEKQNFNENKNVVKST